MNFLEQLALSLPRGSPIDEQNRLALDRVKSMSVMRAPMAVKALTIGFDQSERG